MQAILLGFVFAITPAQAELISGAELQLICEARAQEQRTLAKHDHGKYTVEKVREECLALAARNELSYQEEALSICRNLHARMSGAESEPDFAQIRDFVPCAKAAAGEAIAPRLLRRCEALPTPLARSRCLQELQDARSARQSAH